MILVTYRFKCLEEEVLDQQHGVVKWFSDKKVYGFIEGQETEYFVHYSAVQIEGFQTLQQGAKVNFNIQQNDKGPSAINVVVM